MILVVLILVLGPSIASFSCTEKENKVSDWWMTNLVWFLTMVMAVLFLPRIVHDEHDMWLECAQGNSDYKVESCDEVYNFEHPATTPDVAPQSLVIPDPSDGTIAIRKAHVREQRVLQAASTVEVQSVAVQEQNVTPEPVVEQNVSHWDALADCESGEWDAQGNPIAGSANWSVDAYHDGGLQFHPGTWDAFRPADYPQRAFNASRSQQILVAERVQAAQGWGAWPVCSIKVGLR